MGLIVPVWGLMFVYTFLHNDLIKVKGKEYIDGLSGARARATISHSRGHGRRFRGPCLTYLLTQCVYSLFLGHCSAVGRAEVESLACMLIIPRWTVTH